MAGRVLPVMILMSLLGGLAIAYGMQPNGRTADEYRRRHARLAGAQTRRAFAVLGCSQKANPGVEQELRDVSIPPRGGHRPTACAYHV